MDQTLSLSDPSPSGSSPTLTSSGPAAALASPPEEEPESPGRSLRSSPTQLAPADPLAEGIALLAGMGLGLITVLVPIAAVIGDCRTPSRPFREPMRTGPANVQTNW